MCFTNWWKLKNKRIETETNTIAKTTNFVSFVMKKFMQNYN